MAQTKTYFEDSTFYVPEVNSNGHMVFPCRSPKLCAYNKMVWFVAAGIGYTLECLANGSYLLKGDGLTPELYEVA